MEKILIIDDDLHNRFLLKLVLEKEGYTILEADTGEKGIEITYEKKPDVVLLDVMMPDINGFEVFEKIKNTQIPVIFLTALEEKDIKDNVDFIQKPIDINLLIKKIKEKLK